MAQEYAFDRLARVFDNASANYLAEEQRKQRLAEEERRRLAIRGEQVADLKEGRTYAETQRKAIRGEQVADLKEGRTYAETQRKAIRGENREDAEWAGRQVILANLHQKGLLAPGDENDPAKVTAAWQQLTPQAQQQLLARKQAIDEIVAFSRDFDVSDIPGAEAPHKLQDDALFQVAGLVRQKMAKAKQRSGEAIAGQLQTVGQLEKQAEENRKRMVAEVLPEDMAKAKLALERQYGTGASANRKYAEELRMLAKQQAEVRINGAKLAAADINNRINAATRTMNVLDGLNRNQVYLPEAQAAMVDPNAAQSGAVEDDDGDPLDAIRGKKGDGGGVEPPPVAPTPFDEAAKKEKLTEQVRRAAAQFMDIHPRASRTDAQLQGEVEQQADWRSAADASWTGAFNPISSDYKREQFLAKRGERDTAAKQVAEAQAIFQDYIDLLPPEQQDTIRKLMGATAVADPQAVQSQPAVVDPVVMREPDAPGAGFFDKVRDHVHASQMSEDARGKARKKKLEEDIASYRAAFQAPQ